MTREVTLQTICAYFVPFSRYIELFAEIRQLRPTPPAFGAPVGVTSFEFRKAFWHHKISVPLAIMRRCWGHPTFSRFSRRPTCDRQTHTDRQTQGHGITAQSIAQLAPMSVALNDAGDHFTYIKPFNCHFWKYNMYMH